MAKRKWTRMEKIILFGFINCAVALGIIIGLDKKENRDYYVPRHFDGWITIRYSVPGAPPLPERDGTQQIRIPESGYLETSSQMEVGWRKDAFYWHEGSDTTRIPAYVEVEGEEHPHIYVHRHEYYAKSWEHLLKNLEPGDDTTLVDETRLEMDKDGKVTYTTGLKTLEYFYHSATGKSIMFNPPENLKHEGLRSTEDRRVPLQ
ncbi:MAG: hypothetical protein AAFV07_09145 [Bacteroidota bacterium]